MRFNTVSDQPQIGIAMNQQSVSRGSSINDLSAWPPLKNSKSHAATWQGGAIWNRRRSYQLNGDTTSRPFDPPPLHESNGRLKPAPQEGLKGYTQPSPIDAAAIRLASVDFLYGTVSDPDSEIRSHMRAILQPLLSTTPSEAEPFAM